MNRRLIAVLLRPGLYLKRWLFLGGFGVFIAFWGMRRIQDEVHKFPVKLNLQLMLIIVGAGLFLFAVYKFVSSALKYAGFTRQAFYRSLIDQRYLARGPRIVAIGGGTGLATILSGLKEITSNITACVTVTDEGGSSGKLRDTFGMIAPGDIRNCIVALSAEPGLLAELFTYRFQEGDGLKGHSVGNLLIAALTQITGSFESAIRESSRVLSIRGRVCPLSQDDIRLAATMADGTTLRGEAEIGRASQPIARLRIEPENFAVTPEVLAAIREADLVVVGPGSLYTSILPNLLHPECRKALLETPAPVVYICNVMTQIGETARFTASDHVRVVYEHTAPGLFDWILLNSAAPDPAAIERYALEGAVPVKADIDALRHLGLRIMAGDFLIGDVEVETAEGRKHVLRHDATAIALKLLPLCLPEGSPSILRSPPKRKRTPGGAE
ncbi:uridine diphosphate-N-acetylglucosamine-binding protein YvcK [bacterium]|nr:uridine diphosphate-N-acetylglucosamine-binding protein YvcK [bacterium]